MVHWWVLGHICNLHIQGPWVNSWAKQCLYGIATTQRMIENVESGWLSNSSTPQGIKLAWWWVRIRELFLVYLGSLLLLCWHTLDFKGKGCPFTVWRLLWILSLKVKVWLKLALYKKPNKIRKKFCTLTAMMYHKLCKIYIYIYIYICCFIWRNLFKSALLIKGFIRLLLYRFEPQTVFFWHELEGLVPRF